MPPPTLVFDLDGTLVDTAPDLVAATNHALAGLSLPAIPAADLRPWISFGARRMIVEALAMSQKELSGPEVDEMLGQFLGYYEKNIANESRPFAGAIAALDGFRAKGVRLAVCTNKREHLSRSLLGALGLTSMFEAIAGRDTFSVHKPDPGHLTGTIRLAGGIANNAMMIGDSEVDVATAKNAGIPIVAVTFGYSQIPLQSLNPDRLIDHFDQLPAAVDDIFSRLVG